MAEFFAKGTTQDQLGYVTTIKVEHSDFELMLQQGKIIQNFNNPMAFFEPNPRIGAPEMEYLFKDQIESQYISETLRIK